MGKFPQAKLDNCIFMITVIHLVLFSFIFPVFQPMGIITMEAFYITLSLLLCVSLTFSLYVSPDYSAQEVDDTDDYFLKDTPPIKSNNAEASWIEHMLRPVKTNKPDISAMKRFSQNMYPHFDQDIRKRNNGVWIWMPAQGYVSLPKDQQISENESQAKHGKIMRYGKRK